MRHADFSHWVIRENEYFYGGKLRAVKCFFFCFAPKEEKERDRWRGCERAGERRGREIIVFELSVIVSRLILMHALFGSLEV